MIFFKKKIPAGTQEVTAVKLWYVRWESRYSEYLTGVKPEIMAFTSEEDAYKFAVSLQEAFKLIRHTYGNDVKVSEDKDL